MTAVMALLATTLWNIPTGDESITGLATFYDPGIMEKVIANRGMNLDLYKGGLAANKAGDIGRTAWLEVDNRILGPFKIVDCAQKGEHFLERERNGMIVEVGWETAVELDMQGPIPVTLHFFLPEDLMDKMII